MVEARKKKRRKAPVRKPAQKRLRVLRRRRQQRLVLLAVLLTLTGLGLLWGLLQITMTPGTDRMVAFPEAPASVRQDLLYLSYLDSLARDDRALPAGMQETDLLARALVAQDLVARAGVSRRTATSWGLSPTPEEGQGPLNRLFRELNRRGRVILPLYGAALGTHLKDRRLHPGYLVFGQTPNAGPNEADFCAVLTAVNSIQPEYSMLIYRDPQSGELVHATYDDMPEFGYLGGGRLGDDIASVYREYFQMRDARDRKPLYGN